jgi:hypothetical protein
MNPQQILLRAAQLLKSNADDLRRSHTLEGGSWDTTDPIDEAARRDYDEHMAISEKLRLMASL